MRANPHAQRRPSPDVLSIENRLPQQVDPQRASHLYGYIATHFGEIPLRDLHYSDQPTLRVRREGVHTSDKALGETATDAAWAPNSTK